MISKVINKDSKSMNKALPILRDLLGQQKICQKAAFLAFGQVKLKKSSPETQGIEEAAGRKITSSSSSTLNFSLTLSFSS